MPLDNNVIDARRAADDASTFGSMLALNATHEVELSALSPGKLRHLLQEAFAAYRIGDVDAFLIGFDQTANYTGSNFLWFRERFERFVYVDRIVVAAKARGQGHARRLYEQLFELARQAGHEWIGCEVNSTPPNPGSDAFHRALGFSRIGAGRVPGSSKTVRYLMRQLAPAPPRGDG